MRVDFTSFYAAAVAYVKSINPFQCLVSQFLPTPTKLPPNLNPPVFLWLIQGFTYLHYIPSLSLWFVVSLIVGICGALLSFYMVTTAAFFKKNALIFVCIYLLMYSSLMNTAIGQVGAFLLFFMMAGYYFYCRQADYWAGIFWGFMIAVKLFPGLLFFFVYSQKRYKTLLVMFLICLSTGLIPLLSKGTSIYTSYLDILMRVTWYGCNWNASIYGMLFRLVVDENTLSNLLLAKIGMLLICTSLLFWYLKKIRQSNTQYAFCLTLVMMLLMSPFGWFYYFPLLLMPLTLIWQALNDTQILSEKTQALWALCVFLVNFPSGILLAKNADHLISTLTFYSMYFYGLIIMIYLLNILPKEIKKPISEQTGLHHLFPVQMSLALGVFIMLNNLIAHSS